MRTIETTQTFPLSSVKPLKGLTPYRRYCLEATGKALQTGKKRRSLPSGFEGVPFGTIENLEYLRCSKTGSLFLADLPTPEVWRTLLKDVATYRHTPEAFHAEISGSRAENVYLPKREWIENTLRIQGIRKARLLEVMTPPSDLSRVLAESASFAEVVSLNEMDLCHAPPAFSQPFDAAVLLESLDRVDDPQALLETVWKGLKPGGLLFVTALASSGFDVAVLGLHNQYLYPPDRANCFSLQGLELLLRQSKFKLVEVSTPGVLDVEIVQAHRKENPSLPLSRFEAQVLNSDADTLSAFQSFLQQQGLSSFARLVGRKE